MRGLVTPLTYGDAVRHATASVHGTSAIGQLACALEPCRACLQVATFAMAVDIVSRSQERERAAQLIEDDIIPGEAVEKTLRRLAATVRDPEAIPAPRPCPHCAAGAPFKSPAGSERYHMVPKDGGTTYARCSALDPARERAEAEESERIAQDVAAEAEP